MSKKNMNNYEGEIKMTYANYMSLNTNNTKPFLMISELIDNSISSFEVKYDENFFKWPKKEKLKLEININMPKGYKFLEKHEARYKEEAFISVVDNAFGMDKSTLFKSIELDNKKIILGSNKNVHGRGLKQAAFYFGLSLEIFTNNLKESSEMKFDISKVESLNTPIKRSVKVSSYKKRGTKILIQKIYSNKLLKRKNIAILQEALLARYWKFLKNDKLEIIINSNLLDENILINFNSKEPQFLKIKKINDLFLNHKNKEKIVKEIIKKIDNFNDKKNTWIPDKHNIIKEKLKECFLNKENDYFKWTIKKEFGIFDKVQLSLTFWSTGLTSNYSIWRGIYIYEGGRAINHGPEKGRNTGAYLEWFPSNSHSTGSTDNQFIGKLDITNIKNIKAINDKSEIQFEQDVKEELNKFIFFNWKIFNEIHLYIRNPNKNEFSKNFDNKKIQKELTNRYNSQNTEENPKLPYSKKILINKDRELKGDFWINNEFWKIQLLPDESNFIGNEKIITNFNLDEKNKTFIISFNEGADIWNRANKLYSKEFYSDFLYPMIIQLSYQILNFHFQQKNIKCSKKCQDNILVNSLNNDLSEEIL